MAIVNEDEEEQPGALAVVPPAPLTPAPAAAHQPDDIVLARRTADHAVSVSAGLYGLVERAGYNADGSPKWQPSDAMKADGLVHKGDVIPMRYEEACGREDFEPVEG